VRWPALTAWLPSQEKNSCGDRQRQLSNPASAVRRGDDRPHQTEEHSSNAPTLVEPIPVAAPGGSRALLTVEVDDADAVCAELLAHGVKLLNGPIDRPWGRRTAAFADPAGNIWEVAQPLT
jgi:catechol 2,3-dioxygenase-like lactoylglutathione lyase family enzyme